MNQKCNLEEILVKYPEIYWKALLSQNSTIGQNFTLVLLAFFDETVEFQSLPDCSALNDNKPSPELLSAEVKKLL